MSTEKISITLGGRTTELPVLVGTENEYAINIDKLREDTGFVTLDFGYKNTGATTSKITFLDGEEGILRYRGYDIAALAEKSNFVEVAFLLLYGELPTSAQLEEFSQKLKDASEVPTEVGAILKAMPKGTHPMAQLSAVTVALSGVYTDGAKVTEENFINILAKTPVLVAMVIRNSQGLDFVANDKNLDYVANFLQMTFGKPASDVMIDAMDKLLILHADHEQNCSTSTVRIVGSSNANIYASISAGIGALWGPLHGGANQAVLEQLEAIENDGGDTAKFVAMAKDKNSGFRLMGFGHRVYKNFDPRARIIKKSCDEVLNDLGVKDKKLTIATELEQAALHDEYFVSRKLYPNVDFYSGIIYKAMAFPTDTFTTLFALGRLPGWVAQWKEMKENKEPIGRPRQIYIGAPLRSYNTIENR
ncbi:MAG TPA: citrate synthase [Chitinophagales bacterium]|jgi:citrate synthase|nr:citrate synthase [Chitinophagales bacterium]MBP6154249.1 citrate synthase [Chitinophagales bacterium]HQV78285.1 citrate synthase [Chitinophagales bacterium]HQW79436.1 citrate synthase [Chitinophagales bacterium]HRB68264.1 citrate synthase [Chitinophagales bacterium]